jgi:hypothetical protein
MTHPDGASRLEPRLTHGALRTRIKKVRACAHDHDHVRLRRELEQLSAALDEHLAVESSTIAGLPERASRRLRAGQGRIVSTLSALGACLEAGGDPCHCESLALELDALFELQDDAERRSFREVRKSW